MMDDEMDEQWRDAARSYNTPPEPPREAMWEAISRARAAESVVPISGPRRAPRWLAAAAGIAAVLMVGIAIGRASRDPVGPAVAVVNPSADASPDLAPAVSPDDSTIDAPSSVPVREAVGKFLRTPRPPRQLAAAPRGSTPAALRAARRERANVAGDVASEANAYRFAIVEHLTRTEVLLTSFRAQAGSANAAAVDAQFATLTRDLLATTRLLLATRRTDDPLITRLLEDLELVLMQLSQYARDGRRIDLDATNQSLDKRNVLPKLRSSIPAGVSTSAGT